MWVIVSVEIRKPLRILQVRVHSGERRRHRAAPGERGIGLDRLSPGPPIGSIAANAETRREPFPIQPGIGLAEAAEHDPARVFV